MIRFLFKQEIVALDLPSADLTVLNYLREQQNNTSAKEGCASGDCGACTVVLGELTPDGTKMQYRAINSCITFMSALNGKQLITADQLADGGTLHPVQQYMVDLHGSQCGFCTPGFIMSMFALYHQNDEVNREQAIVALSGNLCRCTGYRPIIDATISACAMRQEDKFTASQQSTIHALQTTASQISSDGAISKSSLQMPHSREQLAKAIAQMPDARLVAGSTDLALEVTQQLRELSQLISLAYVPELKQIKLEKDYLSIGAACTLSEMQSALMVHFPALHELIERFASVPIRNQATMGGNIANASPIGDLPPVLLALGAILVVDDGEQERLIAAKDFFIDYRKTALKHGEWLASIRLPLLGSDTQFKAYKISKRMEDDISAVCAVFVVQLQGNKVAALSTGFGGVAATPMQCHELEQTMLGKDWRSGDIVEQGKAILSRAFSPIDDVRASAHYRNQVLANLWKRFWLETNTQTQAIQTRVVTNA